LKGLDVMMNRQDTTLPNPISYDEKGVNTLLADAGKVLTRRLMRILRSKTGHPVPDYLRDDMGLPPLEKKVVVRHYYWQL